MINTCQIKLVVGILPDNRNGHAWIDYGDGAFQLGSMQGATHYHYQGITNSQSIIGSISGRKLLALLLDLLSQEQTGGANWSNENNCVDYAVMIWNSTDNIPYLVPDEYLDDQFSTHYASVVVLYNTLWQLNGGR